MAVDGVQERSHGLSESSPANDHWVTKFLDFVSDRAGLGTVTRCQVASRRRRPSGCCAECTWAGRSRSGAATGRRVSGRLGAERKHVLQLLCHSGHAHYGGEYWDNWNIRIRDCWSSSRQGKGRHSSGSWYFPTARRGGKAGRLYCTSMATMILEVYYRHMPIYGKQAAEEEFPL